MQVTCITPLEECIDGVTIKDYTLDQPIDRSFIDYLGAVGRLEYFKFSRPFFRVTKPGSFVLKGVEGADMVNVLYQRYHSEQEREMCLCFAGYDSAKQGDISLRMNDSSERADKGERA